MVRSEGLEQWLFFPCKGSANQPTNLLIFFSLHFTAASWVGAVPRARRAPGALLGVPALLAAACRSVC